VSDAAWTTLGRIASKREWARVCSTLKFQAGIEPEEWPGIFEPYPSVTLSVSGVFDAWDTPAFEAQEEAVNVEVLGALVNVFAPDDVLLACDAVHDDYWFRPHVQAVAEARAWPIEPFPEGEYSFFLALDCSVGTFGHPWEQSICVFGEPLVAELAPRLSPWLPILRDNT
jgi:hypothetical protein